MLYQIKLEKGKYLIVNDNGSLTILRHGLPWPAADNLKHAKLVLCLAQRIEELEETIRAVVDGELDERGVRGCGGLGMAHFSQRSPSFASQVWEQKLRNVLEQGE